MESDRFGRATWKLASGIAIRFRSCRSFRAMWPPRLSRASKRWRFADRNMTEQGLPADPGRPGSAW